MSTASNRFAVALALTVIVLSSKACGGGGSSGGSPTDLALTTPTLAVLTASASISVVSMVAISAPVAPTNPVVTPIPVSSSIRAPERTDPRVVYWVDPRLPLADLRRWNPVSQVAGPNQMLADAREPGIAGQGGDYALSRGADPLDPARSAFRHRLSPAFPMWGDTYRSEISANWSNDGTNVMQGLDYWIAWAVKLEPDMIQAGGGEVSLLDFHVVPDAGDTQNNSPFHLFLNDNVWRLVSLTNLSAVTLKEQTNLTTLWRESAPATDRWHRFVMKVRFHWDPARAPYLRVWKASGSSPLALIASQDGPNSFNDRAAYLPQKFGLYRWDAWAGASTRTLYSKGFYVLRDLPDGFALDELSMLALLDRI